MSAAPAHNIVELHQVAPLSHQPAPPIDKQCLPHLSLKIHAPAHARAHDGTYLWCNARVSAAGFYGAMGLDAFGDAFEIDLIGPHCVMGRSL